MAEAPHQQISTNLSLSISSCTADSSTSSKATPVPIFMQMMIIDNDDLLTEILLRMPAKSLIRCKLVCKRWLVLISDRHFAWRHTLHHRLHLSYFAPKPSLILCLSETSYYYIQPSPYGGKWVPNRLPPTLVEPSIRSFSNGLFLIQCRNFENPLEDCHVYNPTTRESKKILLNSNDKHRCVIGFNLVFDPLESLHYKIVCVRATKRRSSVLWRSWWCRCQIEVYDSETNAWKLCGEEFLAPSCVSFDKGIYWNGGIHWCGIFFDIQDSAVRKHPEIVLPGDTRTERVFDHYVESKGCLHYIAHLPEGNSVMVFELQRNYTEWLLKYDISLDSTPRPLSILSIIRQESEEDDMMVFYDKGKIMTYKFKDKSVELLTDFGGEVYYQERRIQFSSRRTFQFIETLAPT